MLLISTVGAATISTSTGLATTTGATGGAVTTGVGATTIGVGATTTGVGVSVAQLPLRFPSFASWIFQQSLGKPDETGHRCLEISLSF